MVGVMKSRRWQGLAFKGVLQQRKGAWYLHDRSSISRTSPDLKVDSSWKRENGGVDDTGEDGNRSMAIGRFLMNWVLWIWESDIRHSHFIASE